jgi:hypothetical protein
LRLINPLGRLSENSRKRSSVASWCKNLASESGEMVG